MTSATRLPVPPGPSTFTALTQLGTLRGSLTRVPGFLDRSARQYGPVTSWRMPKARWWLFDDAPSVERILTADATTIIKGRGTQRLRRLLGDGLLTSSEPLHLRQRRLVQPAFHRERVAGYAATMIDLTRQLADRLHDGETVEIDALMNRLTLRIAAKTLFSIDVADDGDTIGRALTEVLAVFPASLSAYGELLDHLQWHPITRRFNAARAQMDAVIAKVIAQRRAAGNPDYGDLLSILLTSTDEDAGAMPDALVRDEALTLLLAGHETTANALAWAWDQLARAPEAEARLHAELDQVLGDRDPEPADVPRLTFAREVMSESMRLRPPAWLMGRFSLKPLQLGGWDVPAGSVLFVSPFVTHRNPRYWKEPDAFRPERWSNGETADLPRGAYFPFGGGTRICIGEAFAWTEGVLLLATLARRFRFTALDAAPVPLDPLVTLRPGRKILMQVASRQPSPA
ncbi:MAG TPA: cytochrome P450 [Candidatus Sulfotelmatobacter sp.]|nr:cytochrome P450 [Candidatus Sulfotelmatobacter sp.]